MKYWILACFVICAGAEQWNQTGVIAFMAIGIPLGSLWLCCGLGTYFCVSQTHDKAEAEYRWDSMAKSNEGLRLTTQADCTRKRHTRLSIPFRRLPKLQLLAIFYDTCALAGLAFADSVPWPESLKPLMFAARVFLFDVSPLAYPYVVWLFFLFVLAMLVSSSPLLRLCNSPFAERLKAKVILPMWKFIFLVPSIGVYTQLLAPLSCTYTVHPPVMDFDHRTACWRGVHLAYVVVATLLLLPYYLLSLLATAGANTLSSNRLGEEAHPIRGSLAEVDLDMALTKPHILIVVFHIKIFVSAICLFFKPYKFYLLGTLGPSLLVMWMVNHKTAPAMIAQLNLLRSLGYFLALVAVAGGMASTIFDDEHTFIPLVVVIGGWIIGCTIGGLRLLWLARKDASQSSGNPKLAESHLCPSDDETPEEEGL